MKTGYFARAHEDGHDSRWTNVHVIDNEGMPICGYKPHKTMQFCFNAEGIYMPYVECKKCLDIIKKKVVNK